MKLKIGLTLVVVILIFAFPQRVRADEPITSTSATSPPIDVSELGSTFLERLVRTVQIAVTSEEDRTFVLQPQHELPIRLILERLDVNLRLRRYEGDRSLIITTRDPEAQTRVSIGIPKFPKIDLLTFDNSNGLIGTIVNGVEITASNLSEFEHPSPAKLKELNFSPQEIEQFAGMPFLDILMYMMFTDPHKAYKNEDTDLYHANLHASSILMNKVFNWDSLTSPREVVYEEDRTPWWRTYTEGFTVLGRYYLKEGEIHYEEKTFKELNN